MKRTETKLLGLELSAVGLEPGQTRTFREMEQWCDAVAEVTGDRSQAISWQRLQQICGQALRKCKLRLCDEVSDEIRESAMAIIFPSEQTSARATGVKGRMNRWEPSDASLFSPDYRGMH